MNIDTLKYVLALAEYQSYSKAAEEMHISQSSLSKQISKLEGELGVKLFDRTTRHICLTVAGSEFLRHAAKILNDVDEAEKAMQEYCIIQRGELVIGTIPVICYFGLASLIVSFQKRYPGIKLKLKEAETKLLIQLRKNLKIDAAFVTFTDDTELNSTFELFPIITDHIVLVTPQFHPLAAYKSVDFKDIVSEKFVSMTNNSLATEIFINACKKAGFTPDIVYESDHIDMILGFVSSGLGVSLLTSQIAKKFIKGNNIKIVNLNEKINVTIALAIPKEKNLMPGIRAFKKYTLEWFKK
ncbi:LysR family transcriptional regulator [Clostridium sp. JS66]|uniref:LysR family transcriptional regulator n=1 Tax=Clostridium sp. JS66 TaxID=3064705 RepID=UPI00298DC001|nr:LysR family transcriptional regulator [Clostridium sp. JS66]WPC40245.1 LysR family transcriptional regulator [Clostridium sp. JS66]